VHRLALLAALSVAATACAHAPASAPEDAAPASLGDFPLNDQAGHQGDYIDVEAARALARENVLSAADFDAAVTSHRAFLADGGAGGRWDRVFVADFMMGIYAWSGGTGPDGEPRPLPDGQARLERLTLADDVETRGLQLPWATFCGSSLTGRDLRGATLTGSLMSDADLRAADLRGAALQNVDFSDSDLRGADLRAADLRGADFENADLRDADLRGADLTGSRFPGAKLDGVRR